MDKAVFFNSLRGSSLFPRGITASQVKGMEGLLESFLTHGDGKSDTLAYGLATAYHETATRMTPVREGLATTDAGARSAVNRLALRRGPNSAVARYAKPQPPYGHVYYGRGHIQLTWKENYAKSSADAGVDLVKHPDQMLDPTISGRVLWRGLLDGRWNSRGFGLRHYLDTGDLINARRTVNILDKAKEIAGYHRVFLKAVEESRVHKTPKINLWGWIMSLLKGTRNA